MAQPKYNNDRTIWIFGTHAAFSALEQGKRRIFQILYTKEHLSLINKLPANLKSCSTMAEDKQIERFVGKDAVHQGIAVEASFLPELAVEDLADEFESKDRVCLVVLDQVSDPHNIGAILRSAAAFKVSAVIIPKNNAPSENATMCKVASGGMELVPLIRVTNLSQTLQYLKDLGFWIYGLDGSAQEVMDKNNLHDKTVFVLGAEDKGMRKLTIENCDMLVKLPISGQMESLNVSNAAAIAFYEFYNSSSDEILL